MQEHSDKFHPAMIASLPCPGDMIQAKKCMFAWENPRRRGYGKQINKDQTVMVCAVWMVGAHCRILTIFEGRLSLFSCRVINVMKNWQVLVGQPMIATPAAYEFSDLGSQHPGAKGPSNGNQ